MRLESAPVLASPLVEEEVVVDAGATAAPSTVMLEGKR